MIFVDTGYLIAILDPRDQLHERAMAWSAVVAEPLVVTEHILWEVLNFVSPTANRAKAHALVAQIQAEGSGFDLVRASADLFDSGVVLHAKRDDKSWSLTDCISFILMERRGITRALTHDHHFEQAGFEALLRVEPGD